MKPWGEQVDELVEAESYKEALELLETIEAAILPDKVNLAYVGIHVSLTTLSG